VNDKDTMLRRHHVGNRKDTFILKGDAFRHNASLHGDVDWLGQLMNMWLRNGVLQSGVEAA
jgi:hypothetical protein